MSPVQMDLIAKTEGELREMFNGNPTYSDVALALTNFAHQFVTASIPSRHCSLYIEHGTPCALAGHCIIERNDHDSREAIADWLEAQG